jgi:hypothetical protein
MIATVGLQLEHVRGGVAIDLVVHEEVDHLTAHLAAAVAVGALDDAGAPAAAALAPWAPATQLVGAPP